MKLISLYFILRIIWNAFIECVSVDQCQKSLKESSVIHCCKATKHEKVFYKHCISSLPLIQILAYCSSFISSGIHTVLSAPKHTQDASV